MANRLIEKYVIEKDDWDRIQSYLCEIEIKANELAKKYEKKNSDDFERFFDTLSTFGMVYDDIETKSEKIYYDDFDYEKILYTLLGTYEDNNGTDDLIMLIYCNITDDPIKISKLLDLNMGLIEKTLKENV